MTVVASQTQDVRSVELPDEDTNELVDRLTGRLVKIERKKKTHRRLKRWLLMFFLLALLVGAAGVWAAFNRELAERWIPGIRHWPWLGDLLDRVAGAA